MKVTVPVNESFAEVVALARQRCADSVEQHEGRIEDLSGHEKDFQAQVAKTKGADRKLAKKQAGQMQKAKDQARSEATRLDSSLRYLSTVHGFVEVHLVEPAVALATLRSAGVGLPIEEADLPIDPDVFRGLVDSVGPVGGVLDTEPNKINLCASAGVQVAILRGLEILAPEEAEGSPQDDDETDDDTTPPPPGLLGRLLGAGGDS